MLRISNVEKLNTGILITIIQDYLISSWQLFKLILWDILSLQKYFINHGCISFIKLLLILRWLLRNWSDSCIFIILTYFLLLLLISLFLIDLFLFKFTHTLYSIVLIFLKKFFLVVNVPILIKYQWFIEHMLMFSLIVELLALTVVIMFQN